MTDLNNGKVYCWTFTFTIDPALNSGFTEAFNQAGEPWWWFTSGEIDGPVAGAAPDFTGATCKAVHDWSDEVWSA